MNAGVFVRLAMLIAICMLANACKGPGEGNKPVPLVVSLAQPVGTGSNAPGLYGYETAAFTAEISGGQAPYQLSWFFGGAAENVLAEVTQTGPVIQPITFVALSSATDFTASLLVLDAAGQSRTEMLTFNVGQATDVCWISVDSLYFSKGTIFVTGSDPDGDALRFEAQLDSGNVTITGPFNETANSAEFLVTPNDIIAGGDFSATVRANCINEPDFGGDSDSVNGSFAAFPLAADTLYAIALKTNVAAGEPVRVVVATGDTAQPFQYLSGCGLTCTAGALYVPKSFDAGEQDEDPAADKPIDGVWADMGATDFLSGFQPLIFSTDLGDGRERFDFNITPQGGSDITANGLLFNFELVFSEAGTYSLGFEAVNVVSRTYYSDSQADADYFWGDIENDHAFNTIVVE